MSKPTRAATYLKTHQCETIIKSVLREQCFFDKVSNANFADDVRFVLETMSGAIRRGLTDGLNESPRRVLFAARQGPAAYHFEIKFAITDADLYVHEFMVPLKHGPEGYKF